MGPRRYDQYRCITTNGVDGMNPLIYTVRIRGKREDATSKIDHTGLD